MYRLAVELGMIKIIRRNGQHSNFNRALLDEVKSSEDIDSHPEQVKRKENAKGAKMAPISIDYESQTAVFLGSGKKPYETSVDSCTCRDYFVRRLPCKHIYRLLEELRLHYMEQVDSSGNEGDASEEVHSAVEVSKSKPSFSCCHLYRECSDARHCINENKEYADNCEYNQHLLAGRIFYGQNANDFSKDAYDHVLQIYSSLSDDARDELDRIIYHCYYTKAGLQSIEMIRTVYLSELEEKRLIRTGGTAKDFLDRIKTKELLDIFPQWKYLEQEVRKLNKDASPDKKTTLKDLIRQYVSENKPGFEDIDLLTQRFAVVHLNDEYCRYFAEIALMIHDRPKNPKKWLVWRRSAKHCNHARIKRTAQTA